MLNGTIASSTTADDPRGRRAGVRHDVAIPALLVGEQPRPYPCEIRDLSRSGMLLGKDVDTTEDYRYPMEAGRKVNLEFVPDQGEGRAQKVSLPVEIVWRTTLGIGVRYLDMNDDSLATLRGVVRAVMKSRTSDLDNGGFAASDKRRVMRACRKTAQRLLPNIIWTLRSEVSAQLRQKAQRGSRAHQGGAAADAKLIDDKANVIGLTIERHFLQRFAEAVDLDQTQELVFMHMASDDAGGDVVDVHAAARYAAIDAIVKRAKEHYAPRLSELNGRFAVVLGREVDDETNPMLPQLLCRILWDVIIEFCDRPRIRASLKDVITTRIVPLLDELYDELNKTLDDEDVPRAST